MATVIPMPIARLDDLRVTCECQGGIDGEFHRRLRL